MANRSQYSILEYDIHSGGARVDEALAMLERIVSQARHCGPKLFAVITGYGSSGGTCRIFSSVIAKCRKYKSQRHIRGFLRGELAGDFFSKEYMDFPDAASIPVRYKQCPNPGIVFICV